MSGWSTDGRSLKSYLYCEDNNPGFFPWSTAQPEWMVLNNAEEEYPTACLPERGPRGLQMLSALSWTVSPACCWFWVNIIWCLLKWGKNPIWLIASAAPERGKKNLCPFSFLLLLVPVSVGQRCNGYCNTQSILFGLLLFLDGRLNQDANTTSENRLIEHLVLQEALVTVCNFLAKFFPETVILALQPFYLFEPRVLPPYVYCFFLLQVKHPLGMLLS